MRDPDTSGTRLTQQQRGTLIAAAALGLVAVARAWRSRQTYDFSGKSVVITGGSRGLGLVLARELAEAGARLTLIARDGNELARAAADLRSRTPFVRVSTIEADVRRQGDVDRAMRQIVDDGGRVDVIINNAGTIQLGPVDHMRTADFAAAIETHFWGPLYMTLAALPHMRRQREGRIVNIASIGGRVAVPHLLPYCASKFALVGLSDGLRYELARDGIVVTTVCPGLMRTGSPVNALFKGARRQEFAWFAISGALPLTSIDAVRAARQIIDACRRGDAELVITVQAKLAIVARTFAPEVVATLMDLTNRLLPGPVPGGDEARPGRESESVMAPSVLTALSDRAARANNE